MTTALDLYPFNPELDLMLERVVPVPVERVWAAWTVPEQLMQWFTPQPWQTVACTIDLRPGGLFHTRMRGPDGQEFPGDGCYLEIVPQRRLVWTDALLPGYRPVAQPGDACGLGGSMTGVIELEPVAGGTRYRAMALHGSAEVRTRHAEMGFEQGWSAALDQMVALIRGS